MTFKSLDPILNCFLEIIDWIAIVRAILYRQFFLYFIFKFKTWLLSQTVNPCHWHVFMTWQHTKFLQHLAGLSRKYIKRAGSPWCIKFCDQYNGSIYTKLLGRVCCRLYFYDYNDSYICIFVYAAWRTYFLKRISDMHLCMKMNSMYIYLLTFTCLKI